MGPTICVNAKESWARTKEKQRFYIITSTGKGGFLTFPISLGPQKGIETKTEGRRRRGTLTTSPKLFIDAQLRSLVNKGFGILQRTVFLFH